MFGYQIISQPWLSLAGFMKEALIFQHSQLIITVSFHVVSEDPNSHVIKTVCC